MAANNEDNQLTPANSDCWLCQCGIRIHVHFNSVAMSEAWVTPNPANDRLHTFNNRACPIYNLSITIHKDNETKSEWICNQVRVCQNYMNDFIFHYVRQC